MASTSLDQRSNREAGVDRQPAAATQSAERFALHEYSDAQSRWLELAPHAAGAVSVGNCLSFWACWPPPNKVFSRSRARLMTCQEVLHGSRLPLLVFLLLFAIPATSPAQTQITTGAIQGTATDETGAPVPGVTIEARNVGTNLTTQVTAADGRFVFLQLPPGTIASRSSCKASRRSHRTRSR